MKTTLKIESSKPVVIVPLEYYEGLMETIDILSENPKIVEELKKEKEEFLKGNFVLFSNRLPKAVRYGTQRRKKKEGSVYN